VLLPFAHRSDNVLELYRRGRWDGGALERQTLVTAYPIEFTGFFLPCVCFRLCPPARQPPRQPAAPSSAGQGGGHCLCTKLSRPAWLGAPPAPPLSC